MSTTKTATISLAAAASGGLAIPMLLAGTVAGIIAFNVAAQLALARKEALGNEKRSRDMARLAALRREKRIEAQNREAATHAAGMKMATLRAFEQSAAASGLAPRRSSTVSDSGEPGPVPQPPDNTGGLEQSARMLQELRRSLHTLPSAALQNPELPFQRLLARIERFEQTAAQGTAPDFEDLQGLWETVRRSIASLGLDTATEAEIFFRELETLHAESIALALAVESGDLQERAESLRRRVMDIARLGELSRDLLDSLEKDLETLRAEVETRLTWEEFHRQLTQSLQQHLTDMGYQVVRSFSRDDAQDRHFAVFRVPLGEQVEAVIQNDGRMVFTLSHERRETRTLLQGEEIAFYRQQEARWSGDFQELLRRLTAQGFAYGLQLEQCVANDAIPIVVLETADELAQDREERPSIRQKVRRR